MVDEKSCGIVVVRGDEPLYLILRYREGHWSYAKGHVEAGETEERTARRELEEETGITQIDLDPVFRHTIIYDFGPPQKRVHKTVVFFLGNVDAPDVRLSHEHQGHLWLAFDDARKRLTFEKDRMVLDAAREHLAAKKNG